MLEEYEMAGRLLVWTFVFLVVGVYECLEGIQVRFFFQSIGRIRVSCQLVAGWLSCFRVLEMSSKAFGFQVLHHAGRVFLIRNHPTLGCVWMGNDETLVFILPWKLNFSSVAPHHPEEPAILDLLEDYSARDILPFIVLSIILGCFEEVKCGVMQGVRRGSLGYLVEETFFLTIPKIASLGCLQARLESIWGMVAPLHTMLCLKVQEIRKHLHSTALRRFQPWVTWPNPSSLAIKTNGSLMRLSSAHQRGVGEFFWWDLFKKNQI